MRTQVKISKESADVVWEYMQEQKLSYANDAVDEIIEDWAILRTKMSTAVEIMKEALGEE